MLTPAKMPMSLVSEVSALYCFFSASSRKRYSNGCRGSASAMTRSTKASSATHLGAGDVQDQVRCWKGLLISLHRRHVVVDLADDQRLDAELQRAEVEILQHAHHAAIASLRLPSGSVQPIFLTSASLTIRLLPTSVSSREDRSRPCRDLEAQHLLVVIADVQHGEQLRVPCAPSLFSSCTMPTPLSCRRGLRGHRHALDAAVGQQCVAYGRDLLDGARAAQRPSAGCRARSPAAGLRRSSSAPSSAACTAMAAAEMVNCTSTRNSRMRRLPLPSGCCLPVSAVSGAQEER